MDKAGKAKTLTSSFYTEEGVAWAPHGTEIWFSAARLGMSRAIHAVSLSGRERIIERVPQSLLLHDVAADGRALVSHGSVGAGVFFRAPARTRTGADLANMVDRVGHLDNGRKVLVQEASKEAGPEYDLYVDRPTARRPCASASDAARTLARQPMGARLVPQSDDRRSFSIRPGPVKSAGSRSAISRPRSRATSSPTGNASSSRRPSRAAGFASSSWISTEARLLDPSPGGLPVLQPWTLTGRRETGRGRTERTAHLSSRWRAASPSRSPAFPPRISSPARRRTGVPFTSTAATRSPRVCIGSMSQPGKGSCGRSSCRSIRPGSQWAATCSRRPDGSAYAYEYTKALSTLYIVNGLR